MVENSFGAVGLVQLSLSFIGAFLVINGGYFTYCSSGGDEDAETTIENPRIREVTIARPSEAPRLLTFGRSTSESPPSFFPILRT